MKNLIIKIHKNITIFILIKLYLINLILKGTVNFLKSLENNIAGLNLKLKLFVVLFKL